MDIPLRALVIDSDPSVLARVVRRLDHRGFRISARSSAAEALEYVGRARPDVILLGLDYWKEGWGPEFLAASPETVVLPVLETPEVPWRESVA